MSNYLNAKELKAELVACQKAGKISEKLGSMLLLIAQNLTKKWDGGEDIEEATAIVVVDMVKCVFKADVTRTPSSLFSFFSEVGKNALFHVWRTTVRQRQIIDKYTDELRQTKRPP